MIIIAGAGGHAREIRDILDLQGINDILFFDNVSYPLPMEIENDKVIRSIDELSAILKHSPEYIIGTGSPVVRKMFFQLFGNMGGKPVTCISPLATISAGYVTIGVACNIMHRVFLSNHVFIGTGALINAGAQLHHDVSVGEFAEIGPASILLGKVKVGAEAFIGAGAVILPGVQVGDRAIVGAGAVVTKNVAPGAKVKGNPAR